MLDGFVDGEAIIHGERAVRSIETESRCSFDGAGVASGIGWESSVNGDSIVATPLASSISKARDCFRNSVLF